MLLKLFLVVAVLAVWWVWLAGSVALSEAA
jgi:hypothetical protein